MREVGCGFGSGASGLVQRNHGGGGFRRSPRRIARVMQGNYQPETAAGQRFDVAGTLGLIAQRLPQLLDGGADAVVELHNRVVRPQALANLFPRHHLAGMFQQH